MGAAVKPLRLLCGYFAAAVPVPATESDAASPSSSSDLLVMLATRATTQPQRSSEPSSEGDQALASAVHVCLNQRLQLLWEQHARLANACTVTMTKKKAVTSAAARGGKAATRRQGIEGDTAAAPEADDDAGADEGSSASGTEEEEEEEEEAALVESAAASTVAAAAAAATAAADADIAAAPAVAAEARAAALSAKEQEARILTGLLLAPLLAPSSSSPPSSLLSPPPSSEDSSSSWPSCLRLLPFWAPWAEQRALGEVLSHMLQLAASAAAAGEPSPTAIAAEARCTERGFDGASSAVGGGSRALLGLQELLRLAPVQQALPAAIVGLAGKLIEQVTMPG